MPTIPISEDAEKMISTSIRIPKALHQALNQKSREIGLSLAKTLGYLFDQSQQQAMEPKKPDYGLLSYVLLQEAIHNFLEDGQGFIDQALQKSKFLQEPGQDDRPD